VTFGEKKKRGWSGVHGEQHRKKTPKRYKQLSQFGLEMTLVEKERSREKGREG